MPEAIGILQTIMRYPVKSMKGHELSEVFISYSGITGDRVYAFVDKSKKGNFPWMTGRQEYGMIRYEPRFTNAPEATMQHPDPSHFDVIVTSPDGQERSIYDETLRKELEEQSGKSLELRFYLPGMQDSRPVSLISSQSVDQLSKELSLNVDSKRFRMNLLVDWNNNKPFYEDELIGNKIQIGETLVVEINKKDARCVMITLDPKTAQPNPAILKHVALNHGGCIGVYAVVIREGIVKRGDAISLL